MTSLLMPRSHAAAASGTCIHFHHALLWSVSTLIAACSSVGYARIHIFTCFLVVDLGSWSEVMDAIVDGPKAAVGVTWITF